MTNFSRAALKAFFQTGDKPTEAEYGHLIDSLANLTDDQRLLGLSEYDPTKAYKKDSGTFYQKKIYQAQQDTSGSFNALHWGDVTSQIVESNFATWDNAETVELDAYRERNLRIFKSVQAGNQGHDPLTSPTWWIEISANDGVFGNYWKPGIYNFQNVVRYYDSSTGKVRLLEMTAVGGLMSESLQDEIAAGKWRDVGLGTINITPSIVITTGNISGAVSLDLSAGDVWRLTLTGNVTSFTVTNGLVGKVYKVYFIQDATGNRTLSGLATKFKTEDGRSIRLSTAAHAVDLLQLDFEDASTIGVYPIYDRK